MKPRPVLFITLILTALLHAPPAGAARETHLRFEAYWGGLHAANFVLSTRDDGVTYVNDFQLETYGIIGWFLRLKVKAAGRGRSYPFRPESYKVDYTNRFRERSVGVRFGGDGDAAAPTIKTKGATAEEDREKEQKVPQEYRIGVIDPITALVATFRQARASLEGGRQNFILPVYDGRRRFDLKGEFMGTVSRSIRGKRQDTYRVRLTNTPVAGFKESHKEMWNDTVFDMFLSADGRFIPLQFVPVGIGPVMNLVEECAKPCEFPQED